MQLGRLSFQVVEKIQNYGALIIENQRKNINSYFISQHQVVYYLFSKQSDNIFLNSMIGQLEFRKNLKGNNGEAYHQMMIIIVYFVQYFQKFQYLAVKIIQQIQGIWILNLIVQIYVILQLNIQIMFLVYYQMNLRHFSFMLK
ncbi:unnamed protein product [Paramecium pentaurelia]|uniref:Transmembrane protein n=1 Tax=Paramecium pentaurelia TaxID=43138 RepID=A0A8S1UUH3_9CILI|nr:unnamed protein product [Paramecium pentaurelia]